MGAQAQGSDATVEQIHDRHASTSHTVFVDPGQVNAERHLKPQRARANSPRGRISQHIAKADENCSPRKQPVTHYEGSKEARWDGAPLLKPMEQSQACSGSFLSVPSTYKEDYTDPATRLRKVGELGASRPDKGWVKPELALGGDVADVVFGHGEVATEAGWVRAASYTPRVDEGYRPQSQPLFRILTDGAAGSTGVRRQDELSRGALVHPHPQPRSPAKMMPGPRPDGLEPCSGPLVCATALERRVGESSLSSRMREEREARQQQLAGKDRDAASAGENRSVDDLRMWPAHLGRPEERPHKHGKGLAPDGRRTEDDSFCGQTMIVAPYAEQVSTVRGHKSRACNPSHSHVHDSFDGPSVLVSGQAETEADRAWFKTNLWRHASNADGPDPRGAVHSFDGATMNLKPTIKPERKAPGALVRRNSVTGGPPPARQWRRDARLSHFEGGKMHFPVHPSEAQPRAVPRQGGGWYRDEPSDYDEASDYGFVGGGSPHYNFDRGHMADHEREWSTAVEVAAEASHPSAGYARGWTDLPPHASASARRRSTFASSGVGAVLDAKRGASATGLRARQIDELEQIPAHGRVQGVGGARRMSFGGEQAAMLMSEPPQAPPEASAPWRATRGEEAVGALPRSGSDSRLIIHRPHTGAGRGVTASSMLIDHGVLDVPTVTTLGAVPSAISATFGGHGVAAALRGEGLARSRIRPPAWQQGGSDGALRVLDALLDSPRGHARGAPGKRATPEGQFMRRGSLAGGGINADAPSDAIGGAGPMASAIPERRSSVARGGFATSDHRGSGALAEVEGFGLQQQHRRARSAPPVRPEKPASISGHLRGGWARRSSAQRLSDFGASMLRLGSDVPFKGAEEALQMRIEREERASQPGGGREQNSSAIQGTSASPAAALSKGADGKADKPKMRRMSVGGRAIEGGKALGVSNDLKLRPSSDSSAMKGVLCCS